MNARFRKYQLWLLLALGVMAGQEVHAKCFVVTSLGVTPTMRIDATVPAGAIMYNETWNKSLTISCDDIGPNRLYSALFGPGHTRFLVLATDISDTTHTYESTINFSGIEKSVDDSKVTFIFPSGSFSRNFNVSVNLLYRKSTDPITGALTPRITSIAGTFNLLRTNSDLSISGNGGEGQGAFFLAGGSPSVSNTTCAIGSQTVQMAQAPLASFTGVGSVPSAGATNFDVAFLCTNVNAGMRVGLMFSSSDQHASGTAGVIKTNQNADNAGGIALQIINRTTSLPIQFGQFEPGVAKTGNGIYHNIYRVQYFQTGGNPTTGSVRGQTTATVVYQ